MAISSASARGYEEENYEGYEGTNHGNDRKPAPVLSQLEKSEVGRALEQQTFINAVSNNLAIGINDLGSVSAVSSMSHQHDRILQAEIVKQNRIEREKREKEALENQEDTRPLFAPGEKDHIHDTVIIADQTGSPRGRGLKGGYAGPRKWRSFEPGTAQLPPYTIMPSLTRSECFQFQAPERGGFGPPLGSTEKSQYVDPYEIQTDSKSGWQVASPYHGEGKLEFYAEIPKLKKAIKPNSQLHKNRLAARGVLMKRGTKISGHDEALPWYPGTDQENASSSGFHRNHAVTEDLAESGVLMTAMRLRVGERLREERAKTAASGYRQHEKEREERLNKKRVDKDALSLQMAEIDAQLKSIQETRARVDKEKSAVIQAKKEFAAKSNERVLAFRNKRRDMIEKAKQARDELVLKQLEHERLGGGGNREEIIQLPKFEYAYQNIGTYDVGANPVPLSSPYVYSAKDLYKTFSDEDSLYI